MSPLSNHNLPYESGGYKVSDSRQSLGNKIQPSVEENLTLALHCLVTEQELISGQRPNMNNPACFQSAAAPGSMVKLPT
jgi:hypothetical protein